MAMIMASGKNTVVNACQHDWSFVQNCHPSVLASVGNTKGQFIRTKPDYRIAAVATYTYGCIASAPATLYCPRCPDVLMKRPVDTGIRQS